MGIIINSKTKVLVQGITGKAGSKATQEMLDYGTQVSCGVTPGKGGQEALGLPVFDSVQEALEHDPKINTSVIYVPPLLVYDAAMEAIDGKLQTIVIVTENVPVKDVALINEQKGNSLIIGPSSVGVLTVGQGKLGLIGGSEESRMYSKGPVGVISKSGGMCAETSLILTQQGLGQSTIVGMGGDVIAGSTFVDLAKMFEQDQATKVIVVYGEIGGTYEETLAEAIKNKEITKPVIAYVSGNFAEHLGRELALGHAGAIIEKGQGTAEEKKKKLKQAGALVAEYHDDIPDLVKKSLK